MDSRKSQVIIAEFEQEEGDDGTRRLNLYGIPVPSRKVILTVITAIVALVLLHNEVNWDFVKMIINFMLKGAP